MVYIQCAYTDRNVKGIYFDEFFPLKRTFCDYFRGKLPYLSGIIFHRSTFP
jgi:hypothetical protein